MVSHLRPLPWTAPTTGLKLTEGSDGYLAFPFCPCKLSAPQVSTLSPPGHLASPVRDKARPGA
mgnify:CR=1 FL=1